MGRACDGCNRKHITIAKLSQDLQNLQIAHVKQNKANILFTPMAVQRGLKLPTNKSFWWPMRTARLLVRGTRWNIVFSLGQALEDGVDITALEYLAVVFISFWYALIGIFLLLCLLVHQSKSLVVVWLLRRRVECFINK